jgi:hypothetical protein
MHLPSFEVLQQWFVNGLGGFYGCRIQMPHESHKVH